MFPSASISTSTSSSYSTEDDHPAAKYKYRKGRIRKRLQLFLQQSRTRWFTSLSLSMGVVIVSLITISFAALLWHVHVSLVPAEQRQRQLHYTTTATNYATTTATTVLTEKMFQSITEPLWQDQGSDFGVGAVHVDNSNSNSNSGDDTSNNDFAKVIQNNNALGRNAVTSTNMLAKLFRLQRRSTATPNKHLFTQDHLQKLVHEWSVQAISQVSQNLHAGMQWIPSYLLPTVTVQSTVTGESTNIADSDTDTDTVVDHLHDFGILARENRNETTKMAWELEWEEIKKNSALAPQALGPVVDYNDPTKYAYPEIQLDLPAAGTYPEFRTLGEVFDQWPLDQDFEGPLLTETLIHFNYSDPIERQAASKFRDSELPFKLYNVPELTAAGKLWTDEYLIQRFDESATNSVGAVSEAPTGFIPFFSRWDVFTSGLPPARRNDWTYQTWADHATYADASRLAFDQPHFYFQVIHFLGEMFKARSRWPFIARDLPSFSYPETGGFRESYFTFQPDVQQGLECRFGERGVAAPSHYDAQRNFIAMVTGARRYVLAPPRECSKLGIITSQMSPMYRNSILNYRNFKYMHDASADMSDKERAWLQIAAGSQAVETVVKQGEVLYVPCHWFHSITSLQKSSQCNVRSGLHVAGNPEFGGQKEVLQCRD